MLKDKQKFARIRGQYVFALLLSTGFGKGEENSLTLIG